MRGLRFLFAISLLSTAATAADNPYLGTWKLNVAKSKFTPGTASKEETMTFEAVGDQIKRTASGIDPDGQKFNQIGTIPWDGKEHKIDTPSGPAIVVAVKPINNRTLDVTVKADGKVVSTGRSIVSNDGKTLTNNFKGEDPKGRKFDNKEVFEKQ